MKYKIKRVFKKIYDLLPFKKEFFSIWKKFFVLPKPFLMKHLNFMGKFSVKLPNGKDIFFFNWNSSMENQLFWHGITGWHEKKSLDLWMKLATSSKYIVDVGAYRGIYALTAAGMNQEAKIAAFEPVPVLFDRLRHNVEINSLNIECYKLGVSNKNGNSSFYKIDEAGSLTGSFNSASFDDANSEEKKRYTIDISDTITLDSFLPSHNFPQIDLIKIDVEGHECEVIEGMKKILAKSMPTILIEILSSKNAEKIENFLRETDYVYFDINDQTGEIKKVNHLSKASYMNFLICKPEVTSLLRLS